MKSLFQELPPVEIAKRKLVGRMLLGLLVLASALVGATTGLLLVYSTDLPQVEQLEHYRPSSITELYDDQGRVIGSFALQRRVVASYEDYPQVLRDALISVEDKDFYSHWGVNVWRIAGAAYHDIASGGKVQGASTLTMQLARNLFLSPDRSFHRKIQEALLAVQIERRFTKPQIFTLYANQIYLGHGAYGFEAASEFYFGKPAKQLSLDEAALLAGLPKSPGYYSPINHPERATKRRNLVINSMLEDGKITAQQATEGRNQPIQLKLKHDPNSLAPYFVEDLRRYLENKYGSDQVHEGGLRVYTSLDMDLQRAANGAALDGLAAYERRHGWKGRLENVLTKEGTLASYQHPDWEDEPEVNGYTHALVTAVTPGSAAVKFGRYTATLTQADAAWTHLIHENSFARRRWQSTSRLGAGLRRTGCFDRNRQCQCRDQSHGRRTGFQPFQVQPRHAGAAPGGVVLQAIRIHRRYRSGRQTGRYHLGFACDFPDRIRPVLAAQL